MIIEVEQYFVDSHNMLSEIEHMTRLLPYRQRKPCQKHARNNLHYDKYNYS